MKKVLILEDDPKIAEALAIRLRAAGYQALIAIDPAFGAMVAATHRPDLIISDIWMPVAQGFTFARRLKSFGIEKVQSFHHCQPEGRSVGNSDVAGAAGYFEKPYDPHRLMATCRSPRESSTAASRRNSAPSPHISCSGSTSRQTQPAPPAVQPDSSRSPRTTRAGWRDSHPMPHRCG